MVTYAQHSFVGGFIDRALMGRQDVQRYFDSAGEVENLRVAKQGYVAKRRGTDVSCSLAGLFDSSVRRARLIPFSASLERGYYLVLAESEAGSTAVVVVSERGLLCEDAEGTRAYRRAAGDGWSPVAVGDCPYAGDEFDALGCTQSGDTVFVAHKAHPLAKWCRMSDTEFSYEVIDVTNLGNAELPATPANVKLTASGFEFHTTKQSAADDTAYRGSRTVFYKVTAVRDGVESRPSTAVSKTVKLPWQEKASIKIEWDPVDGAEWYNVYKKESAEYGLIGTTKDDDENESETQTSKSKRCYLYDDYISPDLTLTPPKYDKHFEEAGKYPSCVALYQQRLAVASTEKDPFTFWLSATGDLYNFNEHSALREDDAIEATIPATEFPSINHMVLSRDLVLFCENGMWVVAPTSGSSLTYQTITCMKQNSIGTAKSISPLYCGSHVVTVDTDRRTVRGCRYSFANDGLDLADLTVYATDLFRDNPIVRMAWRQNPDMTLWCALSDGTCATLCYMAEQNILAWSHQTLAGGRVEDIAGNKAISDGCDDMALLVRVADGTLEVWRLRPDSDSPETSAQLCMDGVRIVTGAAPGGAAASGEVFVDLETGAETDPAALDPDSSYARGFMFESRLTTVYPQTQGAASQQLHVHDLKKADFRLVGSSSFSVVPRALLGNRDMWERVDLGEVCSDGAFGGFTGDETAVVAGVNSPDGRVSIVHDGAWPWCLTYLALEYSYDPSRGGQG